MPRAVPLSEIPSTRPLGTRILPDTSKELGPAALAAGRHGFASVDKGTATLNTSAIWAVAWRVSINRRVSINKGVVVELPGFS